MGRRHARLPRSVRRMDVKNDTISILMERPSLARCVQLSTVQDGEIIRPLAIVRKLPDISQVMCLRYSSSISDNLITDLLLSLRENEF